MIHLSIKLTRFLNELILDLIYKHNKYYINNKIAKKKYNIS